MLARMAHQTMEGNADMSADCRPVVTTLAQLSTSTFGAGERADVLITGAPEPWKAKLACRFYHRISQTCSTTI